jgi:dolichyl-phosphate-mannose--protein O-mannosyl transferase
MNATIPLVAIAGLVVFIAHRYMGLRIWHAIASTIFGFLLAATTAAPQISHLIAALAQWLQRQ